ncbi:MAG TPA: phosphoribosyltransferase family protein [Ferruginibacter sp.]|nr:phosphoribosyltransferase family protein [Ferruginibacter sp.]
MFPNILEAGLLLAAKLIKYKNDPGIVLAVPRGGVPVAYAVATELGFPAEVILTKKIGHPFNKEYAIGAASLTDYFIETHQDVSEEYIQDELRTIRNRLKEMQIRFMGNIAPTHLKGKTVIVIDDGIATGNTMMATVNFLRKSHPGKIIIAVPVASKMAVQKLAAVADEVVVILVPDEFYGVGRFYKDFEQVSDEEVVFYLDQLRAIRKKESR